MAHPPPFRSPGGPLKDTGDIRGITKLDWQDSLTGLRTGIPTLQDWLWAIPGGLGVPTAREQAIRDALRTYEEAGFSHVQNKFEHYRNLRLLYKAVDDWFKSRKEHIQLTGQVERLHEAVVEKLCRFFHVSVNALPRKLTEIDQHMWDHANNRVFAGRVGEVPPGYAGEHHIKLKLEEFRLSIQNGRVTQWNDVAANYTNVVTTSAPHLYMDGGDDIPATCYGEAGFVFSVWDEFYMAKHDIGLARFHSQYMAGHIVRCAGEMTIVDGIITQISNASGHYRPAARQLLPALWALSMRGVALGNVKACVRQDENYFVCTAADFLGNPTAILNVHGPRSPLVKARYNYRGPRNWQAF